MAFLSSKTHRLCANRSSYLDYLSSTGLPELFHLPNDETKRHYVIALSDTLILRDIVERYDIREVALLKDLFAFLVINVSKFVGIKNEIPIYVQVSYSLQDEDTLIREYTGLQSIRDSYTKVVISVDDLQLPENTGIKHILAWEFDKYIM